jgi:hypothetical protein
MNIDNQDRWIDIVDIEKKFSAAKRLAEHMGIVDGWAVLKANEIVLNSTGIDCLDGFEIPKWSIHKTSTKGQRYSFECFIDECCENTGIKKGNNFTSFEKIYHQFEKFCLETKKPYIHKQLFIYLFFLYIDTNNFENVYGRLFEEYTTLNQDII